MAIETDEASWSIWLLLIVSFLLGYTTSVLVALI